MIFPTPFIFILFLTQVGRVVAQPTLQTVYKTVYNDFYDNPTQTLNNVSCSNLNTQYPTLGYVPGFPFIGGAPNTAYNSLNCGMCWKITNVGNGRSIYFTSIDDTVATDPYLLNLSLEAFNTLGGSIASGHLEATAEMVDNCLCKN